MEPFVSLDFETANRKRGSACSVALVRFGRSGEESDRLSTFLRPHESLDYFDPINMWVHGIQPEDVQGAPSWEEIHAQVVDFVGDLPIVAHNMAFDGYVLTDLDRLYNKEPLLNRRYCTLRLAQKLLPDMVHRRLPDVFERYFPGEFFDHHDAGEDAWACGKIFAQMQEEVGMERLAELCPPTGPSVAGMKPVSRSWTRFSAEETTVEDLVNRFRGSTSLHGHRVAFTGTLFLATRRVLQELVVKMGGEAEKSMTKKTTILVAGIPQVSDVASSKLRKATQLREAGSPIAVMSEEDFLNFLQDGQE